MVAAVRRLSLCSPRQPWGAAHVSCSSLESSRSHARAHRYSYTARQLALRYRQMGDIVANVQAQASWTRRRGVDAGADSEPAMGHASLRLWHNLASIVVDTLLGVWMHSNVLSSPETLPTCTVPWGSSRAALAVCSEGGSLGRGRACCSKLVGWCRSPLGRRLRQVQAAAQDARMAGVQTLNALLVTLSNNPGGLKLSLPLSHWLSHFFRYWVWQYGERCHTCHRLQHGHACSHRETMLPLRAIL